MYEKLIYLAPKNYRDRIRREIIYAGLDEAVVTKFIGFSIMFSIFLSFAIGFDLWLLGFQVLLSIAIGLTTGLLFFGIINLSIILVADSRGREMETLLPDVLQLISANVRAGMTVDKAIWLSARPEFGILEEEIRRVGAKTMGGRPIKIALTEMAQRIKSSIVDRTIKLIIEGIESGGELAKLLDETSNNIRVTQALRKEINSSVMMYTLFIIFAAVLGAPLLYAVSLYFVTVMGTLFGGATTVTQTVAAAGTFGLSFGGGGVQITPTELFYFSIASLLITTIFSSLLIGLIQHGQEKRGVKFIPILAGATLVVFFVARYVIGSLLGSLFVR